MAPSGTERLLPRPKGMMQKVQRWSQPCWICTKARVFSAKAASRWLAVSRTAMMSSTATRGWAVASTQLSGASFCALPRTRSTSGMAA